MKNENTFKLLLANVVFKFAGKNYLPQEVISLSLNNLNELANSIYTELNKETTIDFIGTGKTNKPNGDLTLALEFVRAVIEYKLELKDKSDQRAKKAEERNKLMELLRQKENQQLTGLTIEEIKARIDNLDKD